MAARDLQIRLPQRLAVLGLVGAALALAACDRPETIPEPQVANAPAPATDALPVVPAQRDPSVPDAAAALPPGDAIPPSTEDKAPGVRSEAQSTMSDRESAASMPLPGQANDHSAPTNTAKQPGS